MVFHPIRLALIAVVCSVLGIGGADAKSPARTAPATHPGALAACLETAAGNPALVQACVDRAQGRRR
jgi:hypothetical protein